MKYWCIEGHICYAPANFTRSLKKVGQHAWWMIIYGHAASHILIRAINGHRTFST